MPPKRFTIPQHLEDDQNIGVTAKQISECSCIPPGSVGHYIKQGLLTPIVPNGNVYRVGDLRAFAARQIQITAAKLAEANLSACPDISKEEIFAIVGGEIDRLAIEYGKAAEAQKL